MSLPRAILLVAICAILANLNTLNGEYVLDDRAFFVDNPAMERPVRLVDFFTRGIWAFSNLPDGGAEVNYRPLNIVAVWVKYRLGRQGPEALHLVSVVQHLAVCLLLLLWLQLLLPGGDARIAGWSVALFALHPVHAEAVAWISGALHTQAALFAVGALLLHERFVRTGRVWAGFLAVLAYLAGLLTLELVVFPFFMLLYDRLLRGRFLVWATVPYFVVLAGYFVVRWLVLDTGLPLIWSDPSAWWRMVGFGVEYLRHLLWPWPQPLYLVTPGSGLNHWESWLGTGLLGLGLLYPLWKIRPVPRLPLLGLVWIVTTLAPLLAASFNPTSMLALRALYIPSMGLVLVVAWWLDRPWFRGVSAIWLTGVALLSLGGTLLANQGWHDDGQVYGRIIAWHPGHAAGYAGLAQYRVRSGQTDEAVLLYRAAVERATGKERAEYLEPLALLLGQAGHSSESLSLFRQVTGLDPRRSSAWVGVGNNLWILRRPHEAANAYVIAVRVNPVNREACHNLRMVLQSLRREQELPSACL
ncbi:MAG: hypothetical protein G8237_03425 [Magnetococcales bacterium]|nr:hypothetical protein [Magnetococcales bacterium]NGZ05384.1 hypothetical protein [Magnetococcales bacterium]